MATKKPASTKAAKRTSKATKAPAKMTAKKRPAKRATKAKPAGHTTAAQRTDSRATRTAKAAHNRARTMALKLKGVSHTEIAAELGVSKSRVSQYLREELDALAEQNRIDTDAWRALELERTEALLKPLWPYATGEATAELRERGAKSADEALLLVGVPNLGYVDRVRALIDLRARLLGLEKRPPLELTTPGEGEGVVRFYLPQNGRDEGT